MHVCKYTEGDAPDAMPSCHADGGRRTAPILCPRLRDGHVRLRVREAGAIGVRGTLHPRPGAPGTPGRGAPVLRRSPGLPFASARQVVRELRHLTAIAYAASVP